MSIVDLIFPKSCLGCGKPGRYICLNCIQKVKSPRPICPFCMRTSIDGKVHSFCEEPSGLDGLISLWRYEGVIRKAILGLKYKYALKIAEEISDYAVGEIMKKEAPISRGAVLVPIPLYWYKKNFRGFNQAEEIGTLISNKLNWKFAPKLLIKSSSTVSQTELNRKDRLKNLRGVFKTNLGDNSREYSSKAILFDDVWTTGATLKEACRALKEFGVKEAWGLTLAR